MGRRTVVDERYELLELAAQGAAGSVYRARALDTGAIVALKMVKLVGSDELARFRREVGHLAEIDHPNVVRYLAHGTVSEGVFYLAQEWIEGATLRKHLTTFGCTAAEVVHIGRGVAEALALVHARGIVHRDVKPENLILADGDPRRVKLVDFGIARAANPGGRLTSTGVAVGTPAYMAPEQARGERTLGPEVDVWALGCILYEALSGRPAFRGSTNTAIRAKVILDEVPPIQALCPDAPWPLLTLIGRMMSKLPSRRMVDCGQVLTALREIAVPDTSTRRPVSAPLANTITMDSTWPSDGEATEAQRSIVFLTFLETATSSFASQFAAVEEAAWRNQLDVHILDGVALVVSRRQGRDGALDAARAAMDIKSRAADAVLCVVAQGLHDPLGDAIDRGAFAFERASIQRMFAGIVDTDLRVPVDGTIARLVQPELGIASSGDGHVLQASADAARARAPSVPTPVRGSPPLDAPSAGPAAIAASRPATLDAPIATRAVPARRNRPTRAPDPVPVPVPVVVPAPARPATPRARRITSAKKRGG